jgi:outer membrane protein TolC
MRWTTLITTIIALAAAGLQAQPLTIDTAVETALDANPAVHAAAARAEAGTLRAQQAKSHRWGRLDLAETFNYSNNPAEVFALTLNQERFDFDEFFASDPNRPDALSTWMTTLDLTVPIYTGGHLGARIGQAETMADAEQETLFHTAEQVAFDTTTAFVNLAKAREHVGLLTKTRTTTLEHVKLAEAYAEQGIILSADVLDARVYLSEMDELLSQARNGAQLAEAALNFHMGADQATPRELAPLPPPTAVGGDLAEWTEAAIARRHDLAAARQQLDAGRLETKVARSGYMPEVAVVGRYGLYDDQIFGANGHSGTIMAVAKINLFGGIADSKGHKAAEQTVLGGEADIRRFEEGIRLEVRQAWQDLETARVRHATARDVMAAAEEALRVREHRFKQGLDRMVDLLDAETALREAETRELVARYDVALSTTRLHFVSGATLIPSMEESR